MRRKPVFLKPYVCRRAEVKMVAMKIALGADHAGFELKEKIKARLKEQGVAVEDEGTASTESVDYPDFARKVGESVAAKHADLGVLVCGSGIGMAIAANKVPGIRAANVSTEYEAEKSREHNDANVVTIGSRILDDAKAFSIVDTFLKTAFAGGRHQQRVDKIAAIERDERAAAGRR
jgi:ribose 5-phosphate isomerase B